MQDDRKIVIFSAFSIFDCNCNFRVGHQLNNQPQANNMASVEVKPTNVENQFLAIRLEHLCNLDLFYKYHPKQK